MRKLGLISSMICAVLFLLPVAAQAQATRTWVSGVGDDVNPCSRTAPCKTFPGAISKTAIGGEIDTLDPGSFGTVTIVKAITLASEGSGEAGILAIGTNGVTVNCSVDPNCTVVLRGLQIDGGPTGSNSLAGVKFVAGKTLIVQNCTIRNFTGGAPNGYGVQFTPSAAQPEYLFIDHTSFENNGQPGGTGGNVFVGPTGSPSVNVAINDVQASNAGFGYVADTTGMSGGSIHMSITNSDASGNTNAGVAAITSAGNIPVTINVRGMTINSNGVGLNAKGTNATLRFGGSTIINNTIGTKNTGTMTTYGNNQMNDNGAASGTAPTASPLM